MPTLLLVEDDPRLGRALRSELAGAGYTVTLVTDGATGLRRGLSEPFDAVLLDLMLPGRSGLEVLRGLRDGAITAPILVLTARTKDPVVSQNSIVLSVHRSGAGGKLSNLGRRGCRVAGNRTVLNDGHRARLSFGTPRGRQLPTRGLPSLCIAGLLVGSMQPDKGHYLEPLPSATSFCQAFTRLRRIGSVTAPASSTTSWKAARSKASPSTSSASARSARISNWPVL